MNYYKNYLGDQIIFQTYLQNINSFCNAIIESDMQLITNEDYLTEIISPIGLFNDDRMHPQDSTVSMYGYDVKYMWPECRTKGYIGCWQIPRQLAKFLIQLVKLGNVETYLDIGCFTGITATIVATYLTRFGLKHFDTCDIIDYVNEDIKQIWKKYNLPINYIIVEERFSHKSVPLQKYDVVFVDANHSYDFVSNDFKEAKLLSKKICFHDINDCWCVDVVRLWKEIISNESYKNYYEFIYHSHNFNLMGIGLLEL